MKPTSADDTAMAVAHWSDATDRAVLFDFNGTLSNDEPLLLEIYAEMFLEHLGWTLTSRHYYSRLAGRSDREIIGVIVAELRGADAELEAKLIRERRDRYQQLVANESPISPGARELVETVHSLGINIGIVTGAEREDVEYVLLHAGLAGRFAVIVTASDVDAGKPDPEGFLSAAQQLGVDPAAVLVFEDSLYGIRAAKAAGMTCIAVEGTCPRAELEAEADAVIDVLSGAALPEASRSTIGE